MRYQAPIRTLAAIVGTTASLLAVPTTAGAASAQSCVVDVSRGGTPVCYSTFTEAIAKATGGRVTDAPPDSADAAKDPDLTARLNAPVSKDKYSVTADVLIGIEYYNIGYANPDYIFVAPWGCDSNKTYAEFWFDLWGDWGWNDEISSFRTFSGCMVKHWDLTGYRGDSTPWQYDQYYIGDWMNDRTSSLQWT